MSYLKRPILTLVLNRFKTSAEGWRSGRATMTQYSRYVSAKGTTWAYWERIKSVWKRLWVPESSHVTGMCNSSTLIVLSIRASILFIVPLSRFHSHVTVMSNSCTLIVLSIGASILFIAHAIIALPLRFVGLFALIILRPHCAATETVALMILFKVAFRCFHCGAKVAFRCFQLLHNAFMLWFHFRLTFSTRYIVLVWAPTHCACFKHT